MFCFLAVGTRLGDAHCRVGRPSTWSSAKMH